MSLFLKRAYLFLFIIIFFHIVTPQSSAFQPTVGNWEFVGLNNYIIHSFAVDSSNPNTLYAGTATYGIFKSTDGGTTWNSINNGLSTLTGYFTDIVINPNDSNILYAVGVGFDNGGGTGIFKSTNGGTTWSLANTGITNVGFGGPPADVHSMIIDPNNPTTLYAAIGNRCGSVYKSTNGGATWSRGSGLPCDPTVIRLDPFNPNILYTRSAQGINKSIDGGINWNPISNFGGYSVFYGLTIDPFNSNILYANTDAGIYKTTDGGINWFLSNGSLNNVYKALITDPIRTDTVYIGQNLNGTTGVSVTVNGGVTWTAINNGLPNIGIKRLLVPVNGSNILYAATEVGIYAYGLSPGNQLSVPYFNQNDLPWGPAEYDHSIKLGFTNPTMDRWGCAVTSAAMVLNFHNINQFTDGTIIDPRSLNNWLKNNKGYLTGKGSTGSYSYFNWPIIGKLTKQLFDAGKTNVKLMHKRAYPSTPNILDEDLNQFPDILGVNNSQTSSHFVVAKGKSNNTYSINDPEWNYPTLASFNNSYTQVDRYIPSQTNLSYLVAVVNPDVELLITDPQNNKTGKHFYNNQFLEFNEINHSSYSYQAPISNPNDQDALEELGTGVNEFLLPEPEDGGYEIKISSDENTIYEINISTLQIDGSDNLNKIKGIVSNNSDETLIIHYSQTQPSAINHIVTFQSLIDDIKEAQSLGLIHKSAARVAIELAKSAKSDYEKGRNKIALIKLQTLEKLLNTFHKVPKEFLIHENAYQILLYDINFLKNN